MQALRTSRRVLEAALDNYTVACLALADSSGSSFALNEIDNISQSINTEMKLYTAFEARAARVMRLLGRARNSVISLVPVNSLPDDILLHIFRLVMKEELLGIEALVDGAMPQVLILATSQVCTRWRRVALGSKSLWSEIKLSFRKETFPLGKIFADRSVNLPLNIRVIQPFEERDVLGRRTTTPFFAEVAPRVASFELAIAPPLYTNARPPMPYLYALSRSLKRWRPRQLRVTRLVIFDRNRATVQKLPDGLYYESSAHWFFFPRSMPAQIINEYGKAIRLEVDQQQFEDVLAQVKILELDLIYPFWASKAYHGLLELRLIGPRLLNVTITTQQLASILAASPELRVLHFGLEVGITEASPQPVHLRDLEIFILHSLNHETQQAVLKLILPGRKPLQMSTMYNGSELGALPAQFEDEFCRFFRRSSISYLEVYGNVLDVGLPKLLELLPDLETLVLRQVSLRSIELPDPDNPVAPLCPKLQHLHLRYTDFRLETLRWMVSTYGLQKITSYHSVIGPPLDIDDPDEGECVTALLNICPFIQVLDHDEAVSMKDRIPSLTEVYSRDSSAFCTDYMLH